MNALMLALAWWICTTAEWFKTGHGVSDALYGWWKIAFFAPLIACLLFVFFEIFVLLFLRGRK